MKHIYALLIALLSLLVSACGANNNTLQLLPETDQPIFAFFYTDN